MKDYYNLRNKILFLSIALSLSGAFLFYFSGYKESCFSLLSGTIVGCVNFLLLSRTIARFNGKTAPTKPSFMLRKSLVRFVILGAFIVIIVQKSWFAFFPFLSGLFSIQIVILTLGVFFNNLSVTKKTSVKIEGDIG